MAAAAAAVRSTVQRKLAFPFSQEDRGKGDTAGREKGGRGTLSLGHGGGGVQNFFFGQRLLPPSFPYTHVAMY